MNKKSMSEVKFFSISLPPRDRIPHTLKLCEFGNAIVHFTVVCFETWPLSESEAGGDLVLIQTSCFSYVNAN